jgi:hypothetical protein
VVRHPRGLAVEPGRESSHDLVAGVVVVFHVLQVA